MIAQPIWLLLLVVQISLNLVSIASNSAPTSDTTDDGKFESSRLKVKRDSSDKLSPELETQETGYVSSGYPNVDGYHQTDSDYNYNAGKNSYGKQASDWSLYDQGNHGLYDKYGDKAWNDHSHQDHSVQGKHDSYANNYNSHGGGHGSGYYSRDRGYGYEKHYAYDKEIASKHHADNHNNYGSQHGLHDHYGNSNSQSNAHHGHDKYGQLSRYGNHGYGKGESNLEAHHDLGHNQNYYSHHSLPPPPPPPPGAYLPPSYSSHHLPVPVYRSTYSDYSPHTGFPNGYPSYY